MQNFISYGKQSIDESDIKAVVDVLRGDFLTQGPSIEEFEKDFCSYSGAQHCVAVSNGTAALHLACMAHNKSSQRAAAKAGFLFAGSLGMELYWLLPEENSTYPISLASHNRVQILWEQGTPIIVATEI